MQCLDCPGSKLVYEVSHECLALLGPLLLRHGHVRRTGAKALQDQRLEGNEIGSKLCVLAVQLLQRSLQLIFQPFLLGVKIDLGCSSGVLQISQLISDQLHVRHRVC